MHKIKFILTIKQLFFYNFLKNKLSLLFQLDILTNGRLQTRGIFMKQKIGLILGPLLFLTFYFIPESTGLDDAPRALLAVTLFDATWWITEAITIPATSLIPLILLLSRVSTD